MCACLEKNKLEMYAWIIIHLVNILKKINGGVILLLLF